MKLHIVNLEDNPNDFELNRIALEQAGFDFEMVRVDTREAYLDALDVPHLDIILADYSLPSFDGLTALALACESRPEAPFVFVTGSMGEELAIEAMKRGATDYVLKDKLARLVPAVHRALQERDERAARKQAEAELRQSREQYRALAESTDAIAWEYDIANDRWTYVAPQAERILGFAPAEWKNLAWWMEQLHPDDRGWAPAFCSQMTGKGLAHRMEYRFITRDGGIVWMHEIVNVEMKDGHPVMLRGVMVDITKRKKTEEALSESEARFRGFAEQALVGIYLIQDGVFRYVNPKFAEVFGYTLEECLDSMAFHQLVYPDDQAIVAEWLRKRLAGEVKTAHYTIRGKRKDGSIIHLEIFGSTSQYHGKPAAIGTLLDITDKKQAESRIRQAQKMEAIGTLAGGIAHDFNNILSAILGYGEIVLDSIPEESVAHRDVQQIITAGLRARDLVKQILTFSRLSEQEKKPVRFSLIVKEALKLLRASLPSTIEMVSSVSPGAAQGTVLADPSQLHQILMNLCTNAGHAMREHGGTLTVELEPAELDLVFVSHHSGLAPGRYLKLSVSDTGCGMTEEVRHRIFEPYFTTKGQGEGTGLGLATVYGIVAASHGVITVESEPGKGSRFLVYLPVIAGESEDGEVFASPLPTGHGRVMLVDDEETIVDLQRAMLKKLGYEAVMFTSSTEALAAFREAPDRYDLIITDQTMPHLTGMEMAREMFLLRPSLPVILCTGYSESVDREKAAALGIRRFFSKPVLRKELAEAVSALTRKK